MSNSPWDVQEESPSIRYGKVELIQEEKEATNGNPYWVMEFIILPVENGNIVERKMFTFNRDWNTVTLPSILGLVNSGELANPSEINGRWLTYEWKEWKDYSKNTREYYQENDASKIVADEKGKPHVVKTALHFSRVFENEETCKAEYESVFGSSNEVKNDPIPASMGGDAPDHTVALGFIETVISTNHNDGVVNRDALKTFMENNSGMMGDLTHDHADVIALISKFEAENMAVPA